MSGFNYKTATLSNVSSTGLADLIPAVDTNKNVTVLRLFMANKTAGTVTIDVSVNRNGVDYYYYRNFDVKARGTLELEKMVLETGDALKVQCSNANAVDAIASYVEVGE